MIGGLFSGTVIDRFAHSLQAIVALAIFMPVLMDMGGCWDTIFNSCCPGSGNR